MSGTEVHQVEAPAFPVAGQNEFGEFLGDEYGIIALRRLQPVAERHPVIIGAERQFKPVLTRLEQQPELIVAIASAARLAGRHIIMPGRRWLHRLRQHRNPPATMPPAPGRSRVPMAG